MIHKLILSVLSFMFITTSFFAQNTNEAQKHKIVELEGVLLWHKWGACLYKDDGINSTQILAVTDYVSHIDPGKKVRISGYFQYREQIPNNSLLPAQQGPEKNFVINKILKISESQYERDMVRLKKICGKVKFRSLELDEFQVNPLLAIINQKYPSKIIRAKMSVTEQSSLTITMVVSDIYAYDVIRYIARAGNFDITFDNNMVILSTRAQKQPNSSK